MTVLVVDRVVEVDDSCVVAVQAAAVADISLADVGVTVDTVAKAVAADR